jgi:hypothetical protein
LLHQLGHRADRLLNRRAGVYPVLIIKVDCIDPQPLQRSFDGAADIGRAGVDTGDLVAIEFEAELGRDDQLVALPLDRLADQLLVLEGAIDLRGVEEGDAEVDPRWMVAIDSSSLALPP